MEKSYVTTRYNVRYVQDFNYAPRELFISSSVVSCEDSDTDSQPTCGWQHDSGGSRVPSSQGYCCACSFSEIFSFDTVYRRGKYCGDFNVGTGSASAHCLRFDELWYSGYEILDKSLYYTIKINIYESESNTLIGQLKLDQSNLIDTNTELGATARLIGDYYPSSPAPELGHLYLMVPRFPATHAMVQKPSGDTWMLVDRSQVTLNGLECNKIGVGYQAFREESGKCNLNPGSCLGNQLKELYAADVSLMASGKNPIYLARSRGEFAMCTNANNLYLEYTMTGYQNTQIVLEIPGDKVGVYINVYFCVLQNRAKGRIDEVVAGNFEALSDFGVVDVQVTNEGSLAAAFYVGIAECSENIREVSEVEVSIEKLTTVHTKFRLFANSGEGKYEECTATLKNAKGELVSTKHFNFTITDQYINSFENYTSDPDYVSWDTNGNICTDACSHWYMIFCFITYVCDCNKRRVAQVK
eukprot:TRINITY_DN4363_c0_g1_i7.p1 TRINITY_DN4363_c0_g1~~TRINITY_DN4363_c0_g1_i7.p1  ORF type:complete len:527 (-),score=100.68 TRINITY_DN4363_c0_g1_i7:674-2083(-)